MKVIKKPIIVDAWQLKPYKGIYIFLVGFPWFVNSLEGTMLAHDGDYLIKGVHDELYPCREDVFNDTYTIIKED